jgi:hypothetical protein
MDDGRFGDTAHGPAAGVVVTFVGARSVSMKKMLLVYGVALSGVILVFKEVERRAAGQPSRTGGEDYLEECQREGCNSEEISELCSSYTEECIGEGCSKEEVIELAGVPGSVNAMFNDLARNGCELREQDRLAATCTGVGTETSCAGFLLLCKDSWACADGIVQSGWYVCGGCVGVGSCAAGSSAPRG